MPPRDFLVRLLKNAVAAFAAWFLCALLLEDVFPGFVAPFVDLADLGLLLVFGCVAVLSFERSETTKLKRWFGFFLCAFAAALLGAFAIFLAGTARLNLALAGIGFLGSMFFLKTLFLDTE